MKAASNALSGRLKIIRGDQEKYSWPRQSSIPQGCQWIEFVFKDGPVFQYWRPSKSIAQDLTSPAKCRLWMARAKGQSFYVTYKPFARKPKCRGGLHRLLKTFGQRSRPARGITPVGINYGWPVITRLNYVDTGRTRRMKGVNTAHTRLNRYPGR